ncbi:hypothetical protein NUSPORA_00139 [Nucleospora cyclopteri]
MENKATGFISKMRIFYKRCFKKNAIQSSSKINGKNILKELHNPQNFEKGLFADSIASKRAYPEEMTSTEKSQFNQSVIKKLYDYK